MVLKLGVFHVLKPRIFFAPHVIGIREFLRSRSTFRVRVDAKNLTLVLAGINMSRRTDIDTAPALVACMALSGGLHFVAAAELAHLVASLTLALIAPGSSLSSSWTGVRVFQRTTAELVLKSQSSPGTSVKQCEHRTIGYARSAGLYGSVFLQLGGKIA